MKRQYSVLVCDRCSVQLDPAGRAPSQLRSYAKTLGWKGNPPGVQPRDVCPDCIERGKA